MGLCPAKMARRGKAVAVVYLKPRGGINGAIPHMSRQVELVEAHKGSVLGVPIFGDKMRTITQEDRDALIALIEWYRDEYHRQDWCHTKMIETLRTKSDLESYEIIEAAVDNWID
jgi:hypothetical protein